MRAQHTPPARFRGSLTAVVLLLAATSVAGLGLSAEPSKPATGDPAKGKELFTKKGCVACHKADGSGGLKLTGNPTPDWRDAKRMADPAFDDAYMRDCITEGKPKSGMVPWKRQLKPEQVDDLIVYIRTFSKAAGDSGAKKSAAKAAKGK